MDETKNELSPEHLVALFVAAARTNRNLPSVSIDASWSRVDQCVLVNFVDGSAELRTSYSPSKDHWDFDGPRVKVTNKKLGPSPIQTSSLIATWWEFFSEIEEDCFPGNLEMMRDAFMNHVAVELELK